MQRMTVTIEDDQLAALRAEAAAHGTTVSAVVRAAAETLRDKAPGAASIRRRIEPDRRGGPRSGAGRKAAA
ncbi:MAG: ribbon-helix-helix protein, CopG family [Actinobacteria bacterium]|nr:ribbon-helix-helix protein, CopG family [Actinomycetota bacterium]